MAILNTKSTTQQVLIPTGHTEYPFVIKVLDQFGINEYWLIRANGTLSGDGFSAQEKDKYPQFLSNI